MSEAKGRVLILAGSDSGGGAGVQADIKAVTMLGGFAATAITAVTIQNTLGVQGVYPLPIDVIEAQAQASRSQIELQRAQTRLSQVGATGKGSNFVLRSPIDGVVVERSVNSAGWPTFNCPALLSST